MNKVILAGRLTADPEVRYTQTGKAVASFSLAVNRRFSSNQQSQQGQQQPTADFFNIVAWQKLGEFCGNYLVKASQIIVDGRLQTRSYDAKDGSKRYVTEVIASEIELVGSRPAGAPPVGQVAAAAPTPANQPATSGADSFGSEIPNDEEIPF